MLFGHIWRADGQLIIKVLVEKINKTIPLGRLRIGRINVIVKYFKKINQNMAFELTCNRERWKGHLKAAMVLKRSIN